VFQPLVLQLLERLVCDDLAILWDSISSKVIRIERRCHYLRLDNRATAKNVNHVTLDGVPTNDKFGIREPPRMRDGYSVPMNDR
jgi:hypothetical protein